MNLRVLAMIAGGLLTVASGAAAQNIAPSEQLMSAIRDNEDAKIVSLVESNGRGIVNTRGFNGMTPLTAAVEKKRVTYVGYLLKSGANPDEANRDGEVPITMAARLNWMEGLNMLLGFKAKVDTTNRAGETALIVAVQTRNVPMVRRLLEAGADPDKADHVAGLSARDYARRDNRVRELARLIDSKKPKP